MLSHTAVKYAVKYILTVIAIVVFAVLLLFIDGIMGNGQMVDGQFKPSILGMLGARLIGGAPLIAIIWVWWRSTRAGKPNYAMDES